MRIKKGPPRFAQALDSAIASKTRGQEGASMAKAKGPTTAAFVSQKGGVGKSALARLLAVGALHRGRKTLLADFDLDQLTCVEWGALRLRAGLEPEVDARAFKSLKKLRREDGVADFIVADTRGLADDLSTEIAEDSDVVFLPTGVTGDDLRPTLSLARKLARRGAEGRLVLVLSKVGRSETQFAKAVETIEDAGFELLAEHWPQRDGFQSDLDSGRAGREARNPYLREIAERMEEALYSRAVKAKPRG
ncbi:ParA family protein [Roseiarcus sp.]|jgi:chromosome partitioning protein|uniref:ParA family protein n=1 Tax=Roseiarcus sp. TaxID=1969460 RepID=UPI003D11DC56